MNIFETSVAKEYTYSSALVLTYFSRDARLRKKEKEQIIDIVLVRAVCAQWDFGYWISSLRIDFFLNGWNKEKLHKGWGPLV